MGPVARGGSGCPRTVPADFSLVEEDGTRDTQTNNDTPRDFHLIIKTYYRSKGVLTL